MWGVYLESIMSSDVAELELLLNVANTQIGKLENRITHLMDHIETLEQTNRQQAEYVDRVIDKLNEVLMDITGLYDSYELANNVVMLSNPNKLISIGEIELHDEFKNHVDWIMKTFAECLERHKQS